jgi:excinuclease ABC subunit A
VIKGADFIVDLGPEGGEKGGYIIAQGTPEQVAQNRKSYTGAVLRDVLGHKTDKDSQESNGRVEILSR